jgi:hypothetical protein
MASGAPSASPARGVGDSPRCDRVRLRRPEERIEVGGHAALPESAPPAFITLEAEPETLTSLVAERCAGSEQIAVVAMPAGNRRCGATLVDRAGDRARRLFAEPAADGAASPSGETRWLIPLAELWPDSVLRVVCMPVEAMTGG